MRRSFRIAIFSLRTKQTDGLGHDLRAQKLAGQSLQTWTAMLAFAVPLKLTHLLHHAYLQRRWRRTKRRDVFLSWASGYLRLRFLAGERESCRWCWWRQPDTSLTSYGCCHCPSAQSDAPPRTVPVKYHDAALCTQEGFAAGDGWQCFRVFSVKNNY